jgi:hypothetical protein
MFFKTQIKTMFNQKNDKRMKKIRSTTVSIFCLGLINNIYSQSIDYINGELDNTFYV